MKKLKKRKQPVICRDRNLNAMNRVVNRLTMKAGLPHYTIHGFRHSVAIILDDNGVPLQDISVLLGHEYTSRRKGYT